MLSSPGSSGWASAPRARDMERGPRRISSFIGQRADQIYRHLPCHGSHRAVGGLPGLEPSRRADCRLGQAPKPSPSGCDRGGCMKRKFAQFSPLQLGRQDDAIVGWLTAMLFAIVADGALRNGYSQLTTLPWIFRQRFIALAFVLSHPIPPKLQFLRSLRSGILAVAAVLAIPLVLGESTVAPSALATYKNIVLCRCSPSPCSVRSHPATPEE